MSSYFDGRWFQKLVPQPTLPAAPSGETDSQPQYIADEPLSALRVVRAASMGHVRYARPPEPEALAPLGLTSSAAMSGDTLTLINGGELQDPSFDWTVGQPVILGANGMLTQTQPVSQPFLVVIGLAVATDTIVVRIGLPIFLNTGS